MFISRLTFSVNTVQSTKVHEAYYQCNWYESSLNFRKCLIISMGATQEPLHLSAGKAYIFCLNGFTDVSTRNFSSLQFFLSHQSLNCFVPKKKFQFQVEMVKVRFRIRFVHVRSQVLRSAMGYLSLLRNFA